MKNRMNPYRVRLKGGRTSAVSDHTKQVVASKNEKRQLGKDVQKYSRSLGYKISFSTLTELVRSLGFKS